MFTGFLKDGVVVLSDDGYPIVESAKPEVPPYCKATPSYRMVGGRIIQSWAITPELGRSEAFEHYLTSQILSLDDDRALRYVVLFPVWDSNGKEYKTGDRCTYEMTMYRCLVDHASQPDYNPKDKPDCWQKVVKA